MKKKFKGGVRVQGYLKSGAKMMTEGGGHEG